MTRLLRLLALTPLLALSSAWSADAQGVRYSERADVKAFIAEMRQKHDFPETWLARQFEAAEIPLLLAEELRALGAPGGSGPIR